MLLSNFDTKMKKPNYYGKSRVNLSQTMYLLNTWNNSKLAKVPADPCFPSGSQHWLKI